MSAPHYDLGVPARDVAWAIWASMVAMPLLFLGVVLALRTPAHPVDAAPDDLLLLLAVGTSALGLLLSRVLPPRIPLRQAAGRAHLTALTRCVVRWSLCEAVAIFPLVALLVTHDERQLAVFAVDLVALLLSFPSRGRWRAALPEEPGGSAPRLVH